MNLPSPFLLVRYILVRQKIQKEVLLATCQAALDFHLEQRNSIEIESEVSSEEEYLYISMAGTSCSIGIISRYFPRLVSYLYKIIVRCSIGNLSNFNLKSRFSVYFFTFILFHDTSLIYNVSCQFDYL